MTEEAASTRQKILLAAITCMERDGLEKVRVRSVASEAGVNVAALHYYFGTKEALIQEALEVTLHNAFDLQDLEDFLATGVGLRQAVALYLEKYLMQSQQWPRITMLHLQGPLGGQEQGGKLLERFQGFFLNFRSAVESLLPPATQEEQLQRVAQLWGSLLFAIFVPGVLEGIGVDLSTPEGRQGYVESLLDIFFRPDSPNGEPPSG